MILSKSHPLLKIEDFLALASESRGIEDHSQKMNLEIMIYLLIVSVTSLLRSKIYM